MALVKSAARALDLLELLSAAERPARLSTIVRELGVPKSSVYNLMTTLVERGYAIRNEDGAYELIPALCGAFKDAESSNQRFAATALPVLTNARDLSGETMYIGLPNGDGTVRAFCKVVSKQAIRYDSPNSKSVVGYASIMGRVLLAYASEEDVDAYFARTELIKRTEYTLTDEAAIRAHLAQIREQGYGVMQEEYAIGGCGIAAPLHDHSGKVVAAIDMAIVTSRFAARRDVFLDIVLQSAREIERRMGWRDIMEEGSN